MATVTSHTNLTVTTTYLDLPIGGNTPVLQQQCLTQTAQLEITLHGYPAQQRPGTYPGALTGFQAVNTSANEPVSGLRLISVMVTGDSGTTQKFAVNAFDSSLSRIYAVLSVVNNTDTDESLLAKSNCCSPRNW